MRERLLLPAPRSVNVPGCLSLAPCGSLLVAAAAAAACSGDSLATVIATPTVDAGPLDSAMAPGPAPRFEPCPEGWTVDQNRQPTICEPWPSGTPVVWPCPEKWEPRSVADGVDVCAPGPDWTVVQRNCPEGWRASELNNGIIQGCEPYSSPGPEACGPYQFHLPGEPGCEPVGGRCPQGDFAPDLPSGVPIQFVKAGADGGRGTRLRPWGRLQDVPWNEIPPETIVALAKGRYSGTPRFRRSVSLWGACATETVLIAENGETVVQVSGVQASVELRNLRVDASGAPAVAAAAAARLRLTGVVLENAGGVGVNVESSSLEAEDIVIRNVIPRSSQPGLSLGVLLTGARGHVQRALIEGTAIGILSSGVGSELEAEHILIRDGLPEGLTSGIRSEFGARLDLRDFLVERYGAGLEVSAGARLEARDGRVQDNAMGPTGAGILVGGQAEVSGVEVVRNGGVGVFVVGPGATLQMENVYVGDTRLDSNNQGGMGLRCSGLNQGEAQVEARGAAFVGNRFSGIQSYGGCRLNLEDGYIAETEPNGILEEGSGAIADDGLIKLTRVVLRRNQTDGLRAQTAGRLVLTDVLVEDTLPQASDGLVGTGLSVFSRGQAELRRVAVLNSRAAGVEITNTDSYLDAEDFVIANTEGRSDGQFGRGLTVQRSARARVHRAVIARNRDQGIFVGDRSHLELTESIVAATRSRQVPLRAGGGLRLQDASTASLAAVLVDNNRDIGIAVFSDSRIHLSDTVVRATRPTELEEDFGHGVFVQRAYIHARGLRVLESRDIAVVGLLSTLDLEDVLIDGVTRPPCANASPACSNTASGLLLQGTTARGQRLWVRDATSCGLVVLEQVGDPPWTFDIEDWVLESNGVAVCAENFDIERYRPVLTNNGERLQQDNLPPPPQPIEGTD